jgi:hypothetical protein
MMNSTYKNQYQINWKDNTFYLKPLLSDLILSIDEDFDLDNIDEVMQDSIFAIPHEQWVKAGFSGSSTPNFVLIVHSNADFGYAPFELMSSLKEKVGDWCKDMPVYIHSGINIDKDIVSLCGVDSNKITNQLSKVTCPCCMLEVFSHKNKRPLKLSSSKLKVFGNKSKSVELFNNLKPEWLKIIEQNSNVIIFSPYLTDLVFEIISDHSKNIKAIYTKFLLIDFVCGASKLDVIKSLRERGIDVFYSNELHAKIILTENKVTIGSQNLTSGSENNFELSVLVEGSKSTKNVYKNIDSFIKKAKIINNDMITMMEEAICLAEVPYKEWIGSLNILEKDMLDKSALKEKKQGGNVLRLQKNVETLEHSNWIYCKFGHIMDEMGSWKSPLMPYDKHSSLLNWEINENKYSLIRLNRYLVLNKMTSQIGWARVAKTRITFIYGGIDFNELITLNETTYTISVEARKLTYILKNKQNIAIELTDTRKKTKIRIGGFFDFGNISNVSIIEITPKGSFTPIKEMIQNNMETILNHVLQKITYPFSYKHNLVGVELGKYFTQTTTVIHLSTSLYKGNLFFNFQY